MSGSLPESPQHMHTHTRTQTHFMLPHFQTTADHLQSYSLNKAMYRVETHSFEHTCLQTQTNLATEKYRCAKYTYSFSLVMTSRVLFWALIWAIMLSLEALSKEDTFFNVILHKLTHQQFLAVL